MPSAAGFRPSHAQLARLDHLDERSLEGPRVPGGDETARNSVLDRVLDAADPRTDDRCPSGHRLERDERQSLEV